MILPVAPANINDMQMRKPVLIPRLIMLPIIYIRKDTATRRKEVRKILSTSSMPKANLEPWYYLYYLVHEHVSFNQNLDDLIDDNSRQRDASGRYYLFSLFSHTKELR